MSRVVQAALAALVLLGSAGPAAAQSEAAKARVYYDAGVKAYLAGRYAPAIEAFSAAYAIEPKATLLFSLAQAERRQFVAERDAASLKDAIEHFRKYIAEVPEGGRRADAVEALGELESIAARLDVGGSDAKKEVAGTRVMVSSPTEGAVIELDGATHQEAPLVASVTPGKHAIRVSAPGYFDEQREVVAIADTLIPVEVTLREKPSYLAITTSAGAQVLIDGKLVGDAPLDGPLELSPGSHFVAVTQTGRAPHAQSLLIERGKLAAIQVALPTTTQRKASYGVLLAGAAGFVAAGGLTLGALHKEAQAKDALDLASATNISDERRAEYNASLTSRDALRAGAITTVSVAGALTLTGLGLYFLDNQQPPADRSTARTGRVSLVVGPSSAGAVLQGQF